MMQNTCFFAIALGLSTALFAVEDSGFILESPRALGRGGARVAALDSDEAVRINPATLGETKVKFQIRWFDLDLMVSENTISTISDILDTLSNPQGIASLKKFSENFGKTQFGRGQFSLFSMRFGGFEINPFVSNSAFLNLETPELPQIAWKNDTIAGLNLSYGRQISPSLSLGVTIRPVFRMYVAGSVGTDTFMDLASQKTKFDDISPIKNGVGIGGDLGLVYTPFAVHRFALTFHNLGDTSYSSGTKKLPPVLRQRLSLGYMNRIKIFWGELDSYVDFQDLENRDGHPVLRLFHTGMEWGTSFFTRDHDAGLTLGLHEGYVTAGLFMNFYILRLDISHYTEETGYSVGQSPDNRWAMTLRSSMTF